MEKGKLVRREERGKRGEFKKKNMTYFRGGGDMLVRVKLPCLGKLGSCPRKVSGIVVKVV